MLLKSVFSGFGGQGVLMMGYALALAGMEQGKHVTYMPSYGAEVRGGTANCTVAVSDEEIASPIASSPDFVVVMNYPSLVKYQDMVKKDGTMFINSDLISESPTNKELNVVLVPANTLAHDLGNDRTLNMVMLGAMAQISGVVSPDAIAKALEGIFTGRKAKLVEINRKALMQGAEYVSTNNK